jgi:hypothetical protein
MKLLVRSYGYYIWIVLNVVNIFASKIFRNFNFLPWLHYKDMVTFTFLKIFVQKFDFLIPSLTYFRKIKFTLEKGPFLNSWAQKPVFTKIVSKYAKMSFLKFTWNHQRFGKNHCTLEHIYSLFYFKKIKDSKTILFVSHTMFRQSEKRRRHKLTIERHERCTFTV